MKSIVLKLSILLFVFSSCSRDLSISKRHYRPGYYVSIEGKKGNDRGAKNGSFSSLKDSVHLADSRSTNEINTFGIARNKNEIKKIEVPEKIAIKKNKLSLSEELNEKRNSWVRSEEDRPIMNNYFAALPFEENAKYQLRNKLTSNSLNNQQVEILKDLKWKKNLAWWKEILFWTMLSVGLILLAYGIVTSSLLLIVLGSILLASQFPIFYFFINDIFDSGFYNYFFLIEVFSIILGLGILLEVIAFYPPVLLLLRIGALTLAQFLLWKYLTGDNPSFWISVAVVLILVNMILIWIPYFNFPLLFKIGFILFTILIGLYEYAKAMGEYYKGWGG